MQREGVTFALDDGFVSALKSGRFKAVAETELPGSLYVSGLAVMDTWRRRGIGTELLVRAETLAARYGQISLICFEENEIAMEMSTNKPATQLR